MAACRSTSSTLPSFKPELRFSLPQDRVLVEDSQTQVAVQRQPVARVGVPQLADRSSARATSTSSPKASTATRTTTWSSASRSTSITSGGRSRTRRNWSAARRFGTHNLLFGYEYQRDKYRTEVTAGDDPDCLCGYWWLTIAPMDITTMEETQTPLDIETIERTTFVNDQINAFYVQDQIDLLPQVKLNIGGPRRRLQARYRLEWAGSRSRRFTATRRRSRTAPASCTRRATTSSSTSRRRARSRRSTPFPPTVRSSIPAPRATTRWVIAGRDGTAAWTRASPSITSPATTSRSRSRSRRSVRSASRPRKGWTWTSTRIWAGGRI